MVKKYKIIYKSIGGTSSALSTSSTKNEIIPFSTSSSINDNLLYNSLTLNFLWINNNNNKIIEKFKEIIKKWKNLENVFINLWYHSDYDHINKLLLYYDEKEVDFKLFVQSKKVNIFDLKNYNYKLYDKSSTLNNPNRMKQEPQNNPNIMDVEPRNNPDIMQVEDIKIMDETATDKYGTRELNENFNKDFEMSLIENNDYLNDSLKNKNFPLVEKDSIPFYVKIDYSKNIIMEAQFNKEVCKTKYSCFLDADIPYNDFLKNKYMYTEKDEDENYGVNQEAIDKLDFFGIILGEDIDNGNKYENGFIMIDSRNETVKNALSYANQIMEDLVKKDIYKSYPDGRLKQQTVYQIYPYFFEYLFICLIINDEKLNLEIKDYRYKIEINMEGDFFKRNDKLKELLPKQDDINYFDDQTISTKSDILIENEVENRLYDLIQEKLELMNIIGFKYSIKNLLIFIQNTDWDPDLYEPNEDNKDKNNPLQVLKILYQGQEELFERDKKTYELTEKNISNEYINYIIDNLEVYSEFFYENIEKQTRIDDELRYLLYRGTQSIRNYFNFDVYRKKNKEIHVPVIKTNQPRSKYCYGNYDLSNNYCNYDNNLP